MVNMLSNFAFLIKYYLMKKSEHIKSRLYSRINKIIFLCFDPNLLWFSRFCSEFCRILSWFCPQRTCPVCPDLNFSSQKTLIPIIFRTGRFKYTIIVQCWVTLGLKRSKPSTIGPTILSPVGPLTVQFKPAIIYLNHVGLC